jgi:predicted O-methyltransferase YrrM
MSKLVVLTEFLKRPKKIITNGYQATKIAEKTVDYESKIKSKYNIERLPSIDISHLIPDLYDQLDIYSFLPNTSMITDLLLLRGLAKRYSKCAYLEIGIHRGESLVAVAGVTSDCTGLTLSAAEMTRMGFPKEVIDVQGLFIKDRKDIKVYEENSLTFDFKSLNKKYDLIFVDGDHEHDSVVKDTQNVFKLLKNEQSIIVWHDYGVTNEIVRHEVLAAILEGTPTEYHKNLYHVSSTMCAVFINGNFPTFQNLPNLYPNKYYTVSVKMHKMSE